MLLTRRVLLAATPALLAAAPANPIAVIEQAHGGRLGVFALNTGTGATLANRADERFLLASTFKGPLAAMVLSRIEAGRDTADVPLHFTAKDLLAHSPVTSTHLPAGAIPVIDACEAILEQSDNAAANLLLAHVGGPPALTAYVRGLGDAVTNIDRYELVGGWSGARDTTTPRAIATLARTILLGDALSPASRHRLEYWMTRNVPGQTRLRATFPAGWQAADRTGTADGVCNDYALVRPPGRPPFVVAAYYEAHNRTIEQQEAVLRAVGAAVVHWAVS